MVLLLLTLLVVVNRDRLLLHNLINVLRLGGFLLLLLLFLICWQVFNGPFLLALLATLFIPLLPLAIFGKTLLLILVLLLIFVRFRIRRDHLAL